MVGVSNIESVVGEIIKARSSICKVSWRDYVVLDIVFECASINFLVLISLERLYAVVWPFRLRTTSTRKYIYSIGVVWFLSGLLPVVKLLNVFRLITEGILKKLSSVHSCACLLLISCAYTLIWFFSKKPDPRLPINRQQQNKKLVKTLFIVTFLSLITWLPFTVIHMMRFRMLKSLLLGQSFWRCTIPFRIGNSSINPVVYCFRMPEFRTTIFSAMFSGQNSQRLQFRERRTSHETNGVVLLRVSNLNKGHP